MQATPLIPTTRPYPAPPNVEAKKRRLRILELQAARKGDNTPPEIIMEIEDLEREIAELERQS